MREASKWQDVEHEILNRIRQRIWKPGQIIPNEVDLTEEFGCSRMTVNRALRAVANAGFIDRKRKAGSRVATHPVRKATLSIPIIRHEIEQEGKLYGYQLVTRKSYRASRSDEAETGLRKGQKVLHIRALHTADNEPFCCETRWINPQSVPGVNDVDFSKISANEWLVQNAPFSGGDLTLLASAADADESRLLRVEPAMHLFTIERTTRNKTTPITQARLVFSPGYRMQTSI